MECEDKKLRPSTLESRNHLAYIYFSISSWPAALQLSSTACEPLSPNTSAAAENEQHWTYRQRGTGP